MKHSGKLLTAIVISALSYGCNDTTNVTYTRQLGEPCNEIDQCLSGSFCENGICRKLCAVKEECPSNYTCESNRCILSFEEVITCGNGEENQGEACDDGNRQDGDGCSAQCNVENNYHCVGWPSACKCADGFQDSNHNGICLPDCQGCDASQICLYNADGTADKCACPEGTQDNDNNGVCSPKCGAANQEACGPNSRCDDSSGTAVCECVFLVKKGDSTIWGADALTLEDAITKSQEAAEAGTECQLWLEYGDYILEKSIIGKNIKIYGGFRSSDISKQDRDPDKRSRITPSENYFGNGYRNLFIVKDGSLVLDGIEISNVTSTAAPLNNIEFGGMVANVQNSNVEISNSLFSNNTLHFMNFYGNGNVLNQTNGTLKINNSQFIGNHSSNGGAIYLQNVTSFAINDSKFANNRANNGGAIYSEQSAGEIKNSLFSANYVANQSSVYGGAINAVESQLTIGGSTFKYNYASSGSGRATGGVIAINKGSLNFDKNFVTGNHAESDYGSILGGVIYNEGSTYMVITDSQFIGNSIYSKYKRNWDDENDDGCKEYNGSFIAQIDGTFTGSNLLIADHWAASNSCNYPTMSDHGYGSLINNIKTAGQHSGVSSLKNSLIYRAKSTTWTMGVDPADGVANWNYLDLSNCQLPYNLKSVTTIDENSQEAGYEFLDNNCQLSENLDKYFENPDGGISWVNSIPNEQNDTLIIKTDQAFWQDDELVGKYVQYMDMSAMFSFHLPIIANGADYVVVSGNITTGQFDNLCWFVMTASSTDDAITKEKFEATGAKSITIHDFNTAHCTL